MAHTYWVRGFDIDSGELSAEQRLGPEWSLERLRALVNAPPSDRAVSAGYELSVEQLKALNVDLTEEFAELTCVLEAE